MRGGRGLDGLGEFFRRHRCRRRRHPPVTRPPPVTAALHSGGKPTGRRRRGSRSGSRPRKKTPATYASRGHNQFIQWPLFEQLLAWTSMDRSGFGLVAICLSYSSPYAQDSHKAFLCYVNLLMLWNNGPFSAG